MTIIATRLSPKVEAGFTAAPAFRTNIKRLRSGMETRNADWAIPRRSFSATYGAHQQALRTELLGVLHACMGQLHQFLFKDWSDYSATGTSLGVAPSGTTAVQLVKTYTYGSQTFTRTIKRPVSGTVTVYQAGVAKAGTVDTATGLFTPTTSWTAGQPLTADFQFDVLVRFDADFMEFVLPHRDIAEVSCTLIEVLE